jgi:enoyl-CoA hydratase/carnithine racemase
VSQISEYGEKFTTLTMDRIAGVLTVTCHTDGKALVWGERAHAEWGEAFRAIAQDDANRVLIFTGSGDVFSGPRATPDHRPQLPPGEWDRTRRQAINMIDALLSIEVPIIAALNGPAERHVEIALLSDIVLAADNATIMDSAHFVNGVVPGDSLYVTLALTMGLNRARYFLLTGQCMTAHEALSVGLVNEVLGPEELLPRARELAQTIAAKPSLVGRYTRLVMTELVRDVLRRSVRYGLALEALGIADEWSRAQGPVQEDEVSC